MLQNKVNYKYWKSPRAGCIWINADTLLCAMPELRSSDSEECKGIRETWNPHMEMRASII